MERVAAGFKITNLDVLILSGSYKTLFKMLLSIFEARLKDALEKDLASTIRDGLVGACPLPPHAPPTRAPLPVCARAVTHLVYRAASCAFYARRYVGCWCYFSGCGHCATLHLRLVADSVACWCGE